MVESYLTAVKPVIFPTISVNSLLLAAAVVLAADVAVFGAAEETGAADETAGGLEVVVTAGLAIEVLAAGEVAAAGVEDVVDPEQATKTRAAIAKSVNPKTRNTCFKLPSFWVKSINFRFSLIHIIANFMAIWKIYYFGNPVPYLRKQVSTFPEPVAWIPDPVANNDRIFIFPGAFGERTTNSQYFRLFFSVRN